ncbi:MAG: DUF2442 domain-containing protein [Desulfuromonadales bacterium]|nr:DUF2442 domain-containing protein [Desulfuromonadales bacterium]
MKSSQRGNNIFPAEVTNISSHGIWMLIDTQELFLAFEYFPWFQEASIKKILHVEMPSVNHLYWPELDIDLDINSILYPENYPLVSQQRVDDSTAGKG